MTNFAPLRVRATLDTGLMLPQGWQALDSLLMAAVALRDHLPPLSVLRGPLPMLPIPVALEPAGRFHLCSVAVPRWEAHEVRYSNRRFPLEEAQRLGDAALKRIHLTSGPTKSHRLPRQVGWVAGDALTWWCLGEQEGIADLLRLIGYLGQRRAVGCGRVARWEVEPCEPWGEGFPAVRDGQPLRPLPPDWSDLATAYPRALAVLCPPYHERYREELLAVPEVGP